MQNIRQAFIVLCAFFVLAPWSAQLWAQYNIIPEPVSLIPGEGVFTLNEKVMITAPQKEAVLQNVESFINQVATTTGYRWVR